MHNSLHAYTRHKSDAPFKHGKTSSTFCSVNNYCQCGYQCTINLKTNDSLATMFFKP